tara:strand:- start:1100 stop:1312 length:213 start_codon:yes stop_codon:yes gene_type:complete
MVRTELEKIRVNKYLKPFSKVDLETKIKLKNLSKNPSLSIGYIRTLRALVMKGHTIEEGQSMIRQNFKNI